VNVGLWRTGQEGGQGFPEKRVRRPPRQFFGPFIHKNEESGSVGGEHGSLQTVKGAGAPASTNQKDILNQIQELQ
jgi:hypothetical protein